MDKGRFILADVSFSSFPIHFVFGSYELEISEEVPSKPLSFLLLWQSLIVDDLEGYTEVFVDFAGIEFIRAEWRGSGWWSDIFGPLGDRPAMVDTFYLGSTVTKWMFWM